MIRALLAISLLSLGCGDSTPRGGREFASDLELTKFFKGNLHAHSDRSDGDSSPAAVVRWYRDRGYAFLALSDHDIAPRPGEFVAMTQPGAFVVIPAEEVSYDAVVPGKGLVPVHLNGLCLERTIQKRVFSSVPLALRHGVEQINAQPGAVAMVNHPNYRWSLSEEDLGSLTGAPLLEVANQHPYTNSLGDADHPSAEALWDRLTSSGTTYFGVADDDLHDLWRTERDLGFSPRTEAKGWVQVSAPSLSPRSLCEALASGNFYSSTGVLLGGISATLSRLSLTIISGGSPAGSFITEFIADGGRVVSRQVGLLPSYTLNGDERYLRARVTGPGGTKAWTQPLATHAAPGFQRADP